MTIFVTFIPGSAGIGMYITSIPLSHNFLKAIVSGLELRARGRTDHVSEQPTDGNYRYGIQTTRPNGLGTGSKMDRGSLRMGRAL